jgi:hypothetical protein
LAKAGTITTTHPSSARHGLKWWEIDLNWYGIQVLRRLGLATQIKLPRADARIKLAVSQPAAISVSGKTKPQPNSPIPPTKRNRFRRGPRLDRYEAARILHRKPSTHGLVRLTSIIKRESR